MPIDHFVVVMMENRSFDHYFGWLGETGLVDGLQQATYLDPQGNPVDTRHASTMGAAEWQGCGHPDPGHGWGAGRAQLAGGFMADGSGNDEFALTYYNEGELGFIHDAAKAYTIYDRWFCSQLGPTWPNRYYKWSGQSGGKNNNTPPVDTAGNQWETIFDVALRSDITAQYYNSDLPFSATFGRARRLVDAAGRAVLRGRRGGDAAEHHASSTRRSVTAAASTATRPTSTRTATCDSGRRGWPTWSRRSSSRRTTSAARSSSSTTSGAGSSTTSSRRASRTTARAPTSTRTSARWASGSPP